MQKQISIMRSAKSKIFYTRLKIYITFVVVLAEILRNTDWLATLE